MLLKVKIMLLIWPQKLKEICLQLEINFIYKSSFDKANRTSIASSRGIGIEEGLKILDLLKKSYDIRL